jgi:hypothetical protein
MSKLNAKPELKLVDLLAQLLLAKKQTETEIELTSQKVESFSSVAAKSIASMEQFIGVTPVYSIAPGREGARLVQPVLGRSISNQTLITTKMKQIFSPELQALTGAGGQAVIQTADATLKIELRLEKDVPAITLEDLDTDEAIQKSLKLIACPVNEHSAGTIAFVHVECYEKDDKKSYRNFIETEHGVYSFYTNSDISNNLAAQIGKTVRDGWVGDISTSYAISVDKIIVPEGQEFVANLLRVDVEKIRSKKTGQMFDSFTIVTDKGNFQPSRSMRNDLKLFKPGVEMQLVKPSTEATAYLQSSAMNEAFADLI